MAFSNLNLSECGSKVKENDRDIRSDNINSESNTKNILGKITTEVKGRE